MTPMQEFAKCVELLRSSLFQNEECRYSVPVAIAKQIRKLIREIFIPQVGPP